MDAMAEERMMLTAALTTAQLQLREATPAGFAAEGAELRRRAEGAEHEASQAREAAEAAECKASEGQRLHAEVCQVTWGGGGMQRAGFFGQPTRTPRLLLPPGGTTPRGGPGGAGCGPG